MPLFSGLSAHSDNMHILSAKRDAAGGVAGINGSGGLLVPGSAMLITRSGADHIFFYERQSMEWFLQVERRGIGNYRFIAMTDVGMQDLIHEGKINVANGIAGLDSNKRVPTQYGGMPTGTILPFAGSTEPAGFLLCDGAAVSRTTYAKLFDVIGTSYGPGDGSTTFNLPDLRGRIGVGIGGSGVSNLGDVGGEQEHTLTIDEMPAHSHQYYDHATSGSHKAIDFYDTGTGSLISSTETGGDQPHNNMQPYVGINYIIKY